MSDENPEELAKKALEVVKGRESTNNFIDIWAEKTGVSREYLEDFLKQRWTKFFEDDEGDKP